MIFNEQLLKHLEEYLDMHLDTYTSLKRADHICESLSSPEIATNEIYDFINNNKKPTFSHLVLKHIDKLGFSDPEVYKKAGMDRKHFSKLRTKSNYHPSKNTALALALALELTEDETDELIGAAGYTLSQSDEFDLIISFCIHHKIFDLIEINIALDHFHLKPLGGTVE